MGWRCIAEAARLDEFRPIAMALAGLRITGMELSSSMVVERDEAAAVEVW
jgi:hypothetical protein